MKIEVLAGSVYNRVLALITSVTGSIQLSLGSHESHPHNGRGFSIFSSRTDALSAYEALNNCKLGDNKIILTKVGPAVPIKLIKFSLILNINLFDK